MRSRIAVGSWSPEIWRCSSVTASRPSTPKGTGGDNALSLERRVEIVEAKVAETGRAGATVERRARDDDPEDPVYYVVMHDPEGNEFCVS